LNVVLLPQEVSSASVEFSEEGIANFYEDCIDEGLTPDQYSRIWIHTHPSGIYTPSGVDEKTFEEIFGKCDWAVMYILTKDNHEYCALQYNKTPKHRVELKESKVDYSIPFPASNLEEWEKEYKENVKKKVYVKKEPVINKLSETSGFKKEYPFQSSSKKSSWKKNYYDPIPDPSYQVDSAYEEFWDEEDFWEDIDWEKADALYEKLLKKEGI
jgi:proteasome lid subunit RPN8/RPN11